MNLNLQKIEAKRVALGMAWKYYTGTYALTNVDITTPVPNFNPASGIPLVVFVNTVTGEIKLFPAAIFE